MKMGVKTEVPGLFKNPDGWTLRAKSKVGSVTTEKRAKFVGATKAPAMLALERLQEDVRAAAEVAEQRRVEGYAFALEHIAKRGRLRRGLSARRATDILLTILSAETYHHLAIRRGWSQAECGRWFRDVLAQQLLP